MSFGKVPTVTILRRGAKVRINESDYDLEKDKLVADEAPAEEGGNAAPETGDDDTGSAPYVAKGPFGKWYIHDAEGNRDDKQYKTKKEAEAAMAAETTGDG